MPSEGWLNMTLLMLSMDESKLREMRDRLGLTASISGVFEDLIQASRHIAAGELAKASLAREAQCPARRGRSRRAVHVALREATYQMLSARAKAEGISMAKAAMAMLWIAAEHGPASETAQLQRELAAYRSRYGELNGPQQVNA